MTTHRMTHFRRCEAVTPILSSVTVVWFARHYACECSPLLSRGILRGISPMNRRSHLVTTALAAAALLAAIAAIAQAPPGGGRRGGFGQGGGQGRGFGGGRGMRQATLANIPADVLASELKL